MRASFFLAALATLLVCCHANMKVEGDQMRKLLEHSSKLEGQRMEELYNAEPPLVTEKTIQEAKHMHMGAPLNGMHAQYEQGKRPQAYRKPRGLVMHHGMMLEGEQPSAFANIPAWVHILTFVGAVGAITLMFYLTERMWDKRQQSS